MIFFSIQTNFTKKIWSIRGLIRKSSDSQASVFVFLQADKAELGDLMLTLVYLPSARRLTVIVVKAVNLKIMDITGASDPYVKVSLIQGGKRIRKRKTSVHRRTVNPVFNEALFFDIGEEQLDDSHLLVQVIDHDRYSLLICRF